MPVAGMRLGTPQPPRAARPGLPIRTWLVGLVLAAVLPVLAFGVFMVARTGMLERDAVRSHLLDTTLALSLGIDREIAGMEAVGRTLAEMVPSTPRDMSLFEERARHAALLPGSWIVLTDPSGQEVVNTRLAPGTPLPRRRELQSLKRVVTSEAPAISDMFRAQVTGLPAVQIDVPVRRGGAIRCVLTIVLSPESIQQILRDQHLPTEWISGIFDRNGITLARSRGPRRFVDRPGQPDLIAALRRSSSGFLPNVSREGIPLLNAFVRSDLTGWSTVIGVPEALADGPVWHSLGLVLAGGALLLLLGILLAAAAGHRLLLSVKGMERAAAALASGAAPERVHSNVRELDAVGEALAAAHGELSTRAAERDRSAEALRESEARLSRLLDTAPFAIIEIDGGGAVSFANPAAERMLGLKRAELESRRYNAAVWGAATLEGRPLAPADLAVARALRGETVAGYEHVLRRGSGEEIVVSVNAVPMRDAAGAVAGALLAVSDVTARHEAQRALQALTAELERRVAERTGELEMANRELVAQIERRERAEAALREAQKFEAIGHLTGGVAHDFNNLLTIIANNLDLLDGLGTTADRTHKRLVEGAQRAATRGARLTSQLLAFARRQTLHPEIIDLGPLIAEFEGLLRRAVGEAVTIDLDFAEDLWHCRLDPTQFENALLNLAVNARDAMPKGGELVLAARNLELAAGEVSGVPPGAYVCLSVADTGDGIAPEHLEHVVEPFFTTKETGKGSGLGLSQVYGFVTQSGGRLRIASTPGRGTVVTMYLPKAAEAPLQHRAAAPAPRPAAGSATILLVEDDADVLDVTLEILKSLGYSVLTARDGVEALSLVESDVAIDLLLTDMVMPHGMSGLDLARQALQRRPGLPVIFASGYSDEALRQGREGLDDFVALAKPFRAPELAAALSAALARRGTRRGA